MKNIDICIASDNGYAEHMHVAIYSLLYNLKKWIHANIHILDGGISEINKNKIKNNVNDLWNWNIEFVYVDPEKYLNLPELHLTKEMYYRIEIPELFRNIDKILYLDCDIIVDQDISDVFDYNLEGFAIGAPSDIWTKNYYESLLKIPNIKWYFNSWVLLMNLGYMRTNNLSKKIFDYIEDTKLITWDQDALNAILYDKRLNIPLKFNALDWVFIWNRIEWFTEEELYEAKKHPVCIHYAWEKPWKKYCSHPLKHKYNEYRKLAWLSQIELNKRFILEDLLKHIKRNLWLYLLTHLSSWQYKRFIWTPLMFFVSVKNKIKIRKMLLYLMKIIIKPFLNTWIWNYEPFKTINRRYSALHESTIKTKHGFLLKTIVDDVLIKRALLNNWEREPEITNIIKWILKEGDTFVDIWANIWYYSVLWATLVWEKGSVISIEPSKKIFNVLKNNIEINNLKNISALNLGVWMENKNIELFYCKENPWQTSIVNREFGSKKESIQIKTLDSIWDGKVDLIKMDIEGYEYEWFLWMKNTLLSNKNIKIIFERSPRFYKNKNWEPDKDKAIKILQFLKENDFRLFEVNGNNKTEIHDFDDLYRKTPHQTDIFCTRD